MTQEIPPGARLRNQFIRTDPSLLEGLDLKAASAVIHAPMIRLAFASHPSTRDITPRVSGRIPLGHNLILLGTRRTREGRIIRHILHDPGHFSR